MFLNGSLENFSVTDILQLLSFSRQTGALYVEGEVTATLYLADGDAYFADTDRSPSLEDLLIGRGLSSEAWEQALTQTAGGPVDEWLLQQGLVDAPLLADVAYGAISTALFELFRMPRDGTFDFRAGERHLSGASQRFNVDDLIAEARNRVAEWEAIAETISSPLKLLHVAERLPHEQVQITLDASQWTALLMAARRTSFTLATLASETGVSEADAARALNPLIGAGLVAILEEIEEGEQVEAAAVDEAPSPQPQPEQQDEATLDPSPDAAPAQEPGEEAEATHELVPQSQGTEVGDFDGAGPQGADEVPGEAAFEVPDFIDSDYEEAATAEGDSEGYELAEGDELAEPLAQESESDFAIPVAESDHGEAERELEPAGPGAEEAETALTESWQEALFETQAEDQLADDEAGEEAPSWEGAAAGVAEPDSVDESLSESVPTAGASEATDWEADQWASPFDYQVISEEGLEDVEDDPLAGLELAGDPLDAGDFLELDDTDPAVWGSADIDESGDAPEEQPGPGDREEFSSVDEGDADMGGGDQSSPSVDPEVSPEWDLDRWSVEAVSEQEATPSAFEWTAPQPEAEAPGPAVDEAGVEPLALQDDESPISSLEDAPARDHDAFDEGRPAAEDQAVAEGKAPADERAPTEDQFPEDGREPDYGVAGFRTVALQELRDLAGTGAPPPPAPARTSSRRGPEASPPKPSPEAAAPKVRALRRIIAAVRGL
ncbi:MAG: DUF4388 domain-containing protein [Actinobacteria bacterium]|nr:DUF4388 domain-containing protein [Actinomycetota bacterium]